MKIERDKVLWEKLRGVTKHKHKWNGGRCVKCGALAVNTHIDDEICPIPDSFTNKDGSIASDADVAEEIRQYVLNTDGLMSMYVKKIFALSKQAVKNSPGIIREIWLTVNATPTDKITAFTAMFKESE